MSVLPILYVAIGFASGVFAWRFRRQDRRVVVRRVLAAISALMIVFIFLVILFDVKESRLRTQYGHCAIVAAAQSLTDYTSGAWAEERWYANVARLCGALDDPTALGRSVPEDRLRVSCQYLSYKINRRAVWAEAFDINCPTPLKLVDE
jgi:hypothetical protein